MRFLAPAVVVVVALVSFPAPPAAADDDYALGSDSMPQPDVLKGTVTGADLVEIAFTPAPSATTGCTCRRSTARKRRRA